jgi:hypothetical protein
MVALWNFHTHFNYRDFSRKRYGYIQQGYHDFCRGITEKKNENIFQFSINTFKMQCLLLSLLHWSLSQFTLDKTVVFNYIPL